MLIVGILLGLVPGAAGAILWLYLLSKRAPVPNYMKGKTDAEKLAIARKYLGHITNRTSLSEAQKIASKAIEQTGPNK